MIREEQWLLDEKYGGMTSPEFEADRARLAAGEPLGYLIGYVPFLNATIHLDSRPLIPRPETEFWVERAVADLRVRGATTPRVLDLCAGSGAIGVAVAKAIPEAHVTFAELDKAHLSTIAKNLDVNGVPCTRYQIFQSDLFTNIAGTFDLILSNPPYIDPVLDRAEKSVKEHEPHIALYGGNDGMELIHRIIADSPAHLAENGQLWLEHEPEQSNRIHELAHEHGSTVETFKDQYGIERFSTFQKKSTG